jgi:uridine kinase
MIIDGSRASGIQPAQPYPRLMRYQDVADLIRSSPASCGQVRLVAVDGPGGAGKSLFAARLARALDGAPVIHTDDFASWDNPHNWWDRFEDTVLKPLERGEVVRYQAFDWAARRMGAWREVPTRDIVIIEGVSSSRTNVVDRLTLAIWLDTPPDERLARGIARDGESMRGQWQTWMAEENAFFAGDQTRIRAHLVADGSPSISHQTEEEFVSLDARSRPPSSSA